MGQRLRQLFLVLVVASICAIVLQPFRIGPPNAVRWLDDEPGLVFAGEGLAHGRRALEAGPEGTPLDAMTLAIWLRIPRHSPNWGPREIVSLYDGRPSPPILVGLYGLRPFVFTRFDPADPERSGEWFRQLLPEAALRYDEVHFIAASAGPGGWALLYDGEVVARRPAVAAERYVFSGRPVLGNSPGGRRGLWGEVRGLAIFGVSLPPETLVRHGNAVARAGLGSLLGEPDLLALYDLGEGRGNLAEDTVREDGGISLPARFLALPGSMLRRPFDDVRGRRAFWRDPPQNVLLFLPLGALLAGSLGRRITLGFVLSLGLEGLQLGIPSRDASTLDVAWNTLGTAIGAASALKIGRRRAARRQAERSSA